jgi:predicted nucleic acid-binding protein
MDSGSRIRVTRYLLDTATIVDFTVGFEPVRSRLQAMIDAQDELGVCAIQVAEFYSGVPVDQHALWNTFFGALRYWEISQAAAIQAGVFRYSFARLGRPIATPDALIAAVAREVQAIIITSNARHFPMTDVRLLSLRD